MGQQNEELKAIVDQRKRVLSGKRKVIDEDSLITTIEKLQGIRETKEKTRQRRPKRRKVGGGRVSKVQTVSSDEFQNSSDDDNEEVGHISDCIEV